MLLASGDNPEGRQSLADLCLPLEPPCVPEGAQAPLPGQRGVEAAQGGAAVPSSGDCPHPDPQPDPQQLEKTLLVPFPYPANPRPNSLSPTHLEWHRKSLLKASSGPKGKDLAEL